ncbi:MAG: hypothetical protein KDK00_08230, partial [Rhodobacteraceae bacterium]|nr:hypothetical protein [Paracoccaceae bacterium]
TTYTYTWHGSPRNLILPTNPGTYEIRYVQNTRSLTIPKSVIEVVAVSATLEAADTALSGDTIKVDWTGPDYDRDFIAVARLDAPDGKYENYTYARHGSPGDLVMPSEPGQYELRYVMNQDSTILARRPITVVDVTATLDAASQAPAGAKLSVNWTGPNYHLDFLAVAEVDAPVGKYVNYTYSRNGNPGQLLMPADAGEYELRYIMNEGRRILARQPITITAIGASLDAAGEAPIGAPVAVTWTGPDYDRDFIAIAEPGAKANKYLDYAYTRHGSPASVNMPAEPGTYELRYIQNQDTKILATRMITVVDQSAELSAAAEANVGQMLEVTWTGPDYDRDFIALAEAGSPDKKYLSYAYSRHGSPASVQMPAEPGNYELRYVMNANPLKVLARIPLALVAVSASLEAPASASAGGKIAVTWQGPGYQRDYIAIAPRGSKKYLTYAYARNGNPAEIRLPEDPGDYEIWYVMDEGATVLARRALTLE